MGRGKGTEKGKGKGGRREMGKRERRGGNGQGGEGRKCAPPIFTGAPHCLIPGVAPATYAAKTGFLGSLLIL